MEFTIIIIAAFIIWFSSIWIAVLTLLSIIGGWKALSTLNPVKPADRNIHDARYSMSSLKLGLINYRSCVNVFFTETGIIFDIMKIFSIMHKPVFIPYNKISGAAAGKFFSTYAEFKVDGKKIILYGKAGDELLSRLAAHK